MTWHPSHTEESDHLDAEKALSDDTRAKLKAVLEQFSKSFA